MSRIEENILNFIAINSNCSSVQIANLFVNDTSLATVKRILFKFANAGYIVKTGAGKNTRYNVTNVFKILNTINIDEYFVEDIDNRKIKKNFNFNLITTTLSNVKLFSTEELEELERYHDNYTKKSKLFSPQEYNIEMERFAIDLSWKSAQIEGNTYSLLETEQLLKEKKTASGKTKDEAVMLLNHKDAIDFIVAQPNYMLPLTIRKIEDLHVILIKELGVAKNLRTKLVRIIGTNYLPIENEWQIKEAMEQMCTLINNKDNVFEKALLALVLIAYIQPFMDGNKRVARIVSNAVLLNFKYCPLSFRTVSSIDYKKAMLLFYEQNNISAFKKIFIAQYKFAVDNYF